MKTLCKWLMYILVLGFGTKLSAQSQIDVKHIQLELTFDWTKKQALGLATITFSPISATKSIKLDAASLSIKGITLQEKPLKFNYDGGDKKEGLEIFLDKEYLPNQEITIKIDYQTQYENQADPNNISGSFGKGIRFFAPTSTTPLKRKQIWSSGEPENNRYWFPCKEDIADIYTSTFIATVEKPLSVIANGNLIAIKDNHNGTQTFHYESNTSYSNYLTAFVVGEYIEVKQQANHIPIHTFGYPDEKKAVKATVELLPDMMQFIAKKLDYPYPYTQYSQVVVQDYPFPGLNGQHNVCLISDNYIDDYGVHKDFKYLWDGVAVQALAAQWFGNLIMPKNWADIWLNNAFTQYFAGLYTAHSNGKEEYQIYYLPFEKGNVLGDWNNGYKRPVVMNEISDLNVYSNDNYRKFRGALVLRMLQHEIGEEKWWKALQLYVKENANKQVSTLDFQKAIEKTTGESYQWFFDQWIYKIGLPKFEIVQNYDPTQKELKLTVKQVQQLDSASEYAQVAFFEGKVAIEIDDKIEIVKMAAKAENTFTFALTNAPKLVNFDYDEVWLCEKTQEKSYEESCYQLENDLSILGRLAAANHLAAIAKAEKTSSQQKEMIFALLRKQISSNLYWRYRVSVLSVLRGISPIPYNNDMISMLLTIIKTEKSWLKASAILTLGNLKNAKYEEIYLNALKDESDRVINAAATALGKSKSPNAYKILLELANKPSWKSQSRISALNGLQELGDERAADFALTCLQDNRSPRWYLATPVWDYPFAAANTLVALGKEDLGYPILFERFKLSLTENDLNDIFQNVQLMIILGDKRGQAFFELLKEKFKGKASVLEAINSYETQFLETIKS